MNETTKKLDLPAIALAVCGFVLCLGVKTVFKACGPADDGSWMHCHDVESYLGYIGALAGVAGVGRLFVKDANIRTILTIIGLTAGVAAVVLPSVLPMCMMDTMRCHAVMTPFARIMGVLVAGCAAWGLTARREG